MDPSSAVGRVVVLKAVDEEPALNSRYANVEKYSRDVDKYLVHLIDHITTAPPVSKWVTETQFDFVHPRVFPYHSSLLSAVRDDEYKLVARYHTLDSVTHTIRTSILRLRDIPIQEMNA